MIFPASLDYSSIKGPWLLKHAKAVNDSLTQMKALFYCLYIEVGLSSLILRHDEGSLICSLTSTPVAADPSFFLLT